MTTSRDMWKVTDRLIRHVNWHNQSFELVSHRAMSTEHTGVRVKLCLVKRGDKSLKRLHGTIHLEVACTHSGIIISEPIFQLVDFRGTPAETLLSALCTGLTTNEEFASHDEECCS